jgi:hypothetical protein
MAYEYTSEARRADKWALPSIEVFQLTAREAAEQDEDRMWEYSRKHEYRLASMNAQVREAMFAQMIEDEGISGGWFWWTCLPGCMPDSCASGPFASYEAALTDAREDSEDEDEG